MCVINWTQLLYLFNPCNQDLINQGRLTVRGHYLSGWLLSQVCLDWKDLTLLTFNAHTPVNPLVEPVTIISHCTHHPLNYSPLSSTTQIHSLNSPLT